MARRYRRRTSALGSVLVLVVQSVGLVLLFVSHIAGAVFRPAGARNRANAIEPSVSVSAGYGIPTEPTPAAEFRPYAELAIEHFGTMGENEVDWLAELVASNQFYRSESVELQLRKTEDQLSKEDKNALGFRANTFLSQTYMSKLTEKGRRSPLGVVASHFGYTIMRHRIASDIAQWRDLGVTHVNRTGGDAGCSVCKRFPKRRLPIAMMATVPPKRCDNAYCLMHFEPILPE